MHMQAMGMTLVRESHYPDSKFSLYFMQCVPDGVVSLHTCHGNCDSMHVQPMSTLT
jgi:hypothetical protein